MTNQDQTKESELNAVLAEITMAVCGGDPRALDYAMQGLFLELRGDRHAIAESLGAVLIVLTMAHLGQQHEIDPQVQEFIAQHGGRLPALPLSELYAVITMQGAGLIEEDTLSGIRLFTNPQTALVEFSSLSAHHQEQYRLGEKPIYTTVLTAATIEDMEQKHGD